jgi:hypothetical protein
MMIKLTSLVLGISLISGFALANPPTSEHALPEPKPQCASRDVILQQFVITADHYEMKQVFLKGDDAIKLTKSYNKITTKPKTDVTEIFVALGGKVAMIFVHGDKSCDDDAAVVNQDVFLGMITDAFDDFGKKKVPKEAPHDKDGEL